MVCKPAEDTPLTALAFAQVVNLIVCLCMSYKTINALLLSIKCKFLLKYKWQKIVYFVCLFIYFLVSLLPLYSQHKVLCASMIVSLNVGSRRNGYPSRYLFCTITTMNIIIPCRWQKKQAFLQVCSMFCLVLVTRLMKSRMSSWKVTLFENFHLLDQLL